ncbi:MAG: DUF92 domain-containing protein [Terrimonas sp.]|nr:DUF92 domain-containing protein [Terrimonas sp.]OJY88946.1 MAG: hypothetical protein BGP13_02720 [Sphingobacteriales bacterium 40-81]
MWRLVCEHPVLITLILSGGLLSAVLKKLTWAAAFTGCILALLIFAGAGYTGIAMMTTFFITGVIATSWKSSQKFKNGLAENKRGTRTANQVLANAGVPALTGVLFLLDIISYPLSVLIIAACFSSAIADTVSSEMGNVYGRKYYNILTLKKDERGLNGVVSIEGFLFGLGGSILIAAIYGFNYGWNMYVMIIIICGTAGNILDSVLGATLERKHQINNNTVNFLNTLFAGVLAASLYVCDNV